MSFLFLDRQGILRNINVFFVETFNLVLYFHVLLNLDESLIKRNGGLISESNKPLNKAIVELGNRKKNDYWLILSLAKFRNQNKG